MFYLFHVFRSFLPLHNPIGFGGADFIELFVAMVMVAVALSWRHLIGWTRALAERPVWCMFALFLLPIALRLAMIPIHPIPIPLAIDDMSYALLGDTLTHFRFSNPPHAMHRFFETLFVLQEPRYASIYPAGQGMAIAIGLMLFGNPWAGIAISIGAMCAACYWMLRGWVSPSWALAGGVFAALQFGALSQWMNSFWGGAVSAFAGCLVFGALPRIRESGRKRYAILLGVGIGIAILTRPFESILVVVSVALYFLVTRSFGVLLKAAPVIVIAMLPGIVLVAIQNKSVTGIWTTLPYMESRADYGVPTTFLWQPNPVGRQIATPEQRLVADGQAFAHDVNVKMSFLERLKGRVPIYRFYWLAPLLLLIPVFLWRIREPAYLWIVLTVVLFACGTNEYPYFYSHYIAAITCLFVLAFIVALRSLPIEPAKVVIFLCVAHFVFWYGMHYLGTQDFAHFMWQFETEDAINSGDPQGRKAVRDQLLANSGKQLVFVQYAPGHAFQEWVYNRADVDSGQIVWARNLGPIDNQQLLHYYPDRKAWLLLPDSKPPLLTPYFETPAGRAPEQVVPAPDAPASGKPKGKRPPPRFEDIPQK